MAHATYPGPYFRYSPNPVGNQLPERNPRYNMFNVTKQRNRSDLFNSSYSERGWNDFTNSCELPKCVLPKWPVNKQSHIYPEKGSIDFRNEHRARHSGSVYLAPEAFHFEDFYDTRDDVDILAAAYPKYWEEQRKIHKIYFPLNDKK